MKIASITNDRKKLVKTLEKATGLASKYLGAPSFAYEVGPYTVDRAGSITVEDAKASRDVLGLLAARELIGPLEIETADEEKAEATTISLPMAGCSGRSLKNLVFMLHSKSVLLGKSIGAPGHFRVSQRLISALEEKEAEDAEAFLKILEEAGPDALKGLSFEDGKINFIFPFFMESDRLNAYMQLTSLMVKMAKDQVRVRADKCKDTNEKYTFRGWLMHLGMIGDEYKATRRILLKNLRGNTAFRTVQQKEAAWEKFKAKRAAEKEAASEMAFEDL